MPKLNKKYTYLWIIWLLAFGALEYSALDNKEEGDTLSEHIWKVIGTKTENKKPIQWVWRLGLLVLLLWMIPHFMTGWTWFKTKVRA